jgi:hypothetical protein
MSLLHRIVRGAPTTAAMTAAAAVIVLVAPGHAATEPPAVCGELRPGESLARGEQLRSCAGNAVMVHQPDGNVVVLAAGAVVSSTGTAGLATGAFSMRPDGNLVLTAPDGTVLRQSHTVADGPDWTLHLQDDGWTCLQTELSCYH